MKRAKQRARIHRKASPPDRLRSPLAMLGFVMGPGRTVRRAVSLNALLQTRALMGYGMERQ